MELRDMEDHKGSILAPLIFVICLALLPGVGGFVLALFLLFLISAISSEIKARDDSKPMPDNRILGLPYTRPEEWNSENGPLASQHSRMEERENGQREDSAERLMLTAVPFVGFGLFFAFMYLLANSYTAFFIVAGVFWTVIGIACLGLLAIVFIALSRWPGLSIFAAAISSWLTGSVLLSHDSTAATALAASVCWLTTCFLVRRLYSTTVDKKPFVLSLAKNSVPFFVIFGTAAGIALLLPILLSRIPIEMVLGWRGHLEHVRRLLEKYEITSGTSLIVVVGIAVAKRYSRRPLFDRYLNKLWKQFDRTSNWLQRLAFVLAALFSFSFVGSLHGNAIDSASTRIKDFDKVYADLVWSVYLDLTAKLNIEAYQSAWDQLPQTNKDLVIHEFAVNSQAKSIPEAYFTPRNPTPLAQARIWGKAGYLPPNRELIPANKLPSDLPRISKAVQSIQAPSTASDVRVADAEKEAKEAKRQEVAPSWMNGIGGGVVDKFLEYVLDPDHIEFLERLKKSYPITGEFFDVVGKALKENLSARLESASERIAKKKLDHPEVKLANLIAEEAESLKPSFQNSEATSRMTAMLPRSRERENDVKLANARYLADIKSETLIQTEILHEERERLKRVDFILGRKREDSAPDDDFHSPSLWGLREIIKQIGTLREEWSSAVSSSDVAKRQELISIVGKDNYVKARIPDGLGHHPSEPFEPPCCIESPPEKPPTVKPIESRPVAEHPI
jgi:hypothetical protein